MDALELLFAELEIEHAPLGTPLDISIARVDAWCSQLGYERQVFYDAAGITLARLFASGRMSYEFCDDAANGLWGSLVTRGDIEPWPAIFFQVYEAFDAGEYFHGDEADPIETYTRPAVQRVLESYAGPTAFSTAKNSAP